MNFRNPGKGLYLLNEDPDPSGRKNPGPGIRVQNAGMTPEEKQLLINLATNELKLPYFIEISSQTGKITVPKNATILTDQFPGGLDAFVSTIQNNQPTGSNPETDLGATVDVSSFDAEGNFSLDGDCSSYPVALIIILSIQAQYWNSLDIDYIIDNEISSRDGEPGQGFNFRGEWQSGQNYAAYDVVTNSGSTYECYLAINNSTIVPGTDTEHFTPWALKGDKGDTGNKGNAPGFRFKFSLQEGGDPGAGYLDFYANTDNTNYNEVAFIYFNSITDNGIDLTDYLAGNYPYLNTFFLQNKDGSKFMCSQMAIITYSGFSKMMFGPGRIWTGLFDQDEEVFLTLLRRGGNGSNGARGALWYSGAGAPGTIAGQLNNDHYLNTVNGDVYDLLAGVWTLTGNIKGIQGIPGNTGTRGALWYSGSGAPGTISGQLNNDHYLNTTNGDVYDLITGTWTLTGNIKGIKGDTGDPAYSRLFRGNDSSSTLNLITVTVAPAYDAYSDKDELDIYVANANTSATVNINVQTLGNKPVVKKSGNALNIGDIQPGMYKFIYNSTLGKFHLMSPSLEFTENLPDSTDKRYGTDADRTNWGLITGKSSFWNLMPVLPVRTGNTTFTVTGDITSYVTKGLIIKWTESAAVKVAMVSIPSTYSAPNTTITIIGDTMASIDASSLKFCLVGPDRFEFAVAGTLGATGTDVARAFYATEPRRVIGADLQHGTAGVITTFVIDINKNGTSGSMFSTKPSLATTVASSPVPFTADSGTSLALGDKVTADIDAVNTGTLAIDLYIQLYSFPTRLINLT